MQEVVAGLSGKVDNLYSNGLHVAGQKYVLNKVDERSLYARKVRPENTATQLPARDMLTGNTGKGRNRHRQDHTSDPHRPLRREYDCRKQRVGG
jgi:hypothetical protein